jgi:signal transduction histidine kinase
MNSSFKRYFAMTVTVIMLSFVVLGSSFMALSYRYIMTEKTDNLLEHAQVANQITASVLNADFQYNETLDAGIRSVAATGEEDIFICDTTGAIRFAYTEEGAVSEVAGTVPEKLLQEVADSGRYCAVTDLGIYDSRHLVVAVPLTIQTEDGSEEAGVTIVACGVEGFEGLWHSMTKLFLLAAVVVLVVAFCTSWFTCRRMTRPINDITGIVRRFGKGEYQLRMDEKLAARTDEVGELAEAFNAMADAIATQEQQRQEFISNISHELKTPMTTIQGFADGLLDGTVAPEKERASLQVISDETRRLSRLVRRMLDASRLAAQDGGTQVQSQFELNETIARVIISLERKITERGLDMDVQLPDNATMVWGDGDSITQICYNLLDNAAKFATPGTVIHLSAQPKGSKVYVTVSNQGETIPPEELPLIFDRFHKSDRSRSLDKDGVGLGLYIVKTLLNHLNEDITVTSENGLTTFVFTLTKAV